MKAYEFPASALAASLFCAAKGDVRYYLNAVLIEPGKGRIVSTDGTVLFCGEIPQDDQFPDVLIPRDIIEKAVKALGKKGVARTAVDVRILENGTYDLYTLEGTFPLVPVDGKFPDYERIVPVTVSKAAAQYDPDLLVRITDAMNLYAGRSLRGYHLSHNGPSAALYTGTGINAFCLVMPMRTDEAADLGWYRGRKQKAA